MPKIPPNYMSEFLTLLWCTVVVSPPTEFDENVRHFLFPFSLCYAKIQ